MAENQRETLEICRRTIGDQVQFSLAGIRAGHFNRDASSEHFRSVIKARWGILEGLVYAEQNRIDLRERREDPETLLHDALVAAKDVLHGNSEQFLFYVQAHKQKGTPDADEKASKNQMFADRTQAAIDAIEITLKVAGRG